MFSIRDKRPGRNPGAIKTEAEHNAALKFTEAAAKMANRSMAMELHRMQMPTEVGVEQNTMTIVMMPSEFVDAASAVMRLVGKATGGSD